MLIFSAIAGGLILLIIGGETLVRGAVGLAECAGVAPLIVGIVILGFGTSMPELVTSLEASLASAPDIVWGNIVGSNIYNVLGIGGVTAIAANGGVPPSFVTFDIPLLLVLAVGLTLLWFSRHISQFTGGLMVVTYAAYIVWLLLGHG